MDTAWVGWWLWIWLLSISYSAKSLILVNSIYPTRVADALLAKAKTGNGHAADFIIKYGLHRRLLGLKNAFSDGNEPVMLNDLEACNDYQLDINELKNLRISISIILGSKDRLVDLEGCRKIYRCGSKPTYILWMRWDISRFLKTLKS